ncbi:radiation sensitive protein rad9 [Sporothrix epigloea]|uniref:Radiation sensitive protein rad9 n=1 Tax=Sporothrix epigloea TaxID=1892477 RepID=A0ABP0E4K0_9PEZI
MTMYETSAYYDGSGSPTQVNEGRSYDRYEDPTSLPSIDLRATQEAGGDGGLSNEFLNRSLDENESGAVRFGSMHSAELNFESPTAINDGERRGNKGLWRFAPGSDNDLDHGANAAGTDRIDPVTPAPPPKNPFAGRFQMPVVDGSQLFAATPLSATFKQASPTSSRPSPSALLAHQAITATPYLGTSSPMKLRFSNLGDQTPMPVVLFHALSTPSTTQYDATTPYQDLPAINSAAAASVQQSSPTMRRRRNPAPITEYEPMRKSQERRDAVAEAQQADLLSAPGSSSENEADDTMQQRRCIVRRKKDEATRILSNISLSGPTFHGDIVEVPASVRKVAPARLHKRVSRSRMLNVCPESDQPAASTPSEGATTKAEAETLRETFTAPSAGLRLSEAYDDASIPQSIDGATTSELSPAAKTPSSSAAFLPRLALSAVGHVGPTSTPKSSLNRTEAIPETSPLAKWPALVSASDELEPPLSYAAEKLPMPLLSSSGEGPPLTRRREPTPSPTYEKFEKHLQQEEKREQQDEVAILLKKGIRQELSTEPATSSPPIPTLAATSTWRPQRRTARYGVEIGRRNGRASLAASVSSVEHSVSSLSVLSATPTRLSRAGTPVTANESDLSARGSNQKISAFAVPAAAINPTTLVDGYHNDDDSPIASRKRRRRGERPTLSLPSNLSEHEHGATRYSKDTAPTASPIPSESTDELSASPALLAAPSCSRRSSRRFTRSVSKPVSKPISKPVNTKQLTSTSLTSRALDASSFVTDIFAGMVFGVSLQSQRPGEDNRAFARREKQGTDLQARIQEAGGRILRDGFEDLFRPPQIVSSASSRSRTAPDTAGSISGDLQLLPKAADSGFTALIIDGHSRKAKYIQALALGLPCLAPRWITTCLDRGKLVDWAPYLLCAGESSFLGGAMRSRNLVPYDASTARLVNVVQRRHKLMDGLTILVVPGKAAEKTRNQYTFLAHVLGASLSQANNLQEAREHLKAMEEAGRPCDWVYVGEKTELAGLFEDRLRPAAKKRKRHKNGDDDIDRAPAPVKTLSDECFIQSLIFGELIEEDDLDGL